MSSSAGVSELMDAEKKASTVVAEARAARSDRLKAAKAEAGAAVDDLRAARESEHALTTSSDSDAKEAQAIAATAVSDVIGADAERAICPWTFPWPGDFRSILRDNGFRDGVVSHFKRPVKCDPVEWLLTFGKAYLDGVEDQAAFLEAYRAACVRRLPDGEIDYVRLRWRAVRQ